MDKTARFLRFAPLKLNLALAKKTSPNKDLRNVVIDALLDKKGNEVVCLDLRNIPDTVADYFVIAHGDSSPQVRALFDQVIAAARDAGFRPWKQESGRQSEWSIVDFGNVVVHVFHRDKRAFYNLEELWSDAEREDFDEKGKKIKKRKSKI